jgi:hypothetical protein
MNSEMQDPPTSQRTWTPGCGLETVVPQKIQAECEGFQRRQKIQVERRGPRRRGR